MLIPVEREQQHSLLEFLLRTKPTSPAHTRKWFLLLTAAFGVCFGIHNCVRNTASMYVWPESVARRGLKEVVSCLYHYLQSLSGVDTLFLFSDSYGGQNKKSTAIHFCYTSVKMGLKIQHIFLIWGHSYLPCDRDFVKTESKKKRVDCVYTPQHWMDVVRSAKKTKPFVVVSVSQDVIFDFQSHLANSFKKTVSNGGERLWIRDARVFEYSQQHPQELWVKYPLLSSAAWHVSTGGKNAPLLSFPTEPAYSTVFQLAPNKIDDLKELFTVLCPEFRSFYNDIIEQNVDSQSFE